jgi:hypothetical protein
MQANQSTQEGLLRDERIKTGEKETRKASLQSVYHIGRSSWSLPSESPGWEEGRISDNLAAPTSVQEDVNPSLSIEEFEVVSLSEAAGRKSGAVTRSYAYFGR